MSIKSKICSLAIMAATIGFGQAAHAQFATTLKVSGVSRAVQATHAPGDEERLFIVMRSGYIKIYNLERFFNSHLHRWTRKVLFKIFSIKFKRNFLD